MIFRKNNLKAIEKYCVDIVRIFSKLEYTSVGKIYLDGTKIKGNASAKRTKDRAGFEKWLSKIEQEIATILQEAETIDKQEDDTCKVDPEQEALQEKLSDRTYLKRKIEVAADCGYGSYANYEYLEQSGIDGYVPDSNFQQ